jgi:hypothetical protein
MLMGTMPDTELLPWPERLDLGDIGVLTLDTGEQLTAEVVDYDENRDELLFQIVSPSGTQLEESERQRAIPSASIVSFAHQPRDAQPWPHTDPCRHAPFSLSRLLLMTTLFLSMTLGSILLFAFTIGPHRVQKSTAVSYTLFVVFFTFAATKKFPRYNFTCPAVRVRISDLLLRHLCILLAILVLETAALSIRSSLPAWWNMEDQKGTTPFELTLYVLLFGFGWTQILTNRSLLKRSHQNFLE